MYMHAPPPQHTTPTFKWFGMVYGTFQFLFKKSVTAGSAAFVIQLAMGCVQSRSQLWLRGMGAGVKRPSGLYHCLPLI